jgi:DNA-binding transcriptional MerR regulator
LAVAKAVEAFRNIGEVSVELGVKKHVLRFWELKFPQLKPMKRGGGRRLYRPGDIDLLRGIRDLLQDAGYTIKGVQRLLREHGLEHVKKAAAEGAVRAHGRHSSRSAAIDSKPVQLSAQEIEALRTIMAELDTCQGLLAATRNDKGEPGRRRLAE